MTPLALQALLSRHCETESLPKFRVSLVLVLALVGALIVLGWH